MVEEDSKCKFCEDAWSRAVSNPVNSITEESVQPHRASEECSICGNQCCQSHRQTCTDCGQIYCKSQRTTREEFEIMKTDSWGVETSFRDSRNVTEMEGCFQREGSAYTGRPASWSSAGDPNRIWLCDECKDKRRRRKPGPKTGRVW